jgi:hypothetical protein
MTMFHLSTLRPAARKSPRPSQFPLASLPRSFLQDALQLSPQLGDHLMSDRLRRVSRQSMMRGSWASPGPVLFPSLLDLLSH